MTIVCQPGTLIEAFVNFIANSQMQKLILAAGDISKPKTAIKLARKSGNLNHFKNMIISDSTKKTLHIMANFARKPKTELLKICFMLFN